MMHFLMHKLKLICLPYHATAETFRQCIVLRFVIVFMNIYMIGKVLFC